MGKNMNKNMAKILIWNGPNWPMRLKIESTSNAMLFSSLFLTAPGMTVGGYFTSSAPPLKYPSVRLRTPMFIFLVIYLHARQYKSIRCT